MGFLDSKRIDGFCRLVKMSKRKLKKFNGVAFNNKAKEIPISKGMTPEHAGKIINESVELLKKKGIEV
ncbi:unnamed protein product [Wickerhamomyces anomalus]